MDTSETEFEKKLDLWVKIKPPYNQAIVRGAVVLGAGVEPARVAPLVFETSASTDSAIRAALHKVVQR